jgi:membrane fusion protein (multidrug efflux system)
MARTDIEAETAAPERPGMEVPENGGGGNGNAQGRRVRAQEFLRTPRGKRMLLGGALVAALVIAGLWWYYAARESTDDAQIDAHIAPVAARVSGTVAKVLVDNNQTVEQGQVLVQIDPTDYQVAVDRARAELADAEAAAVAARTAVPIMHTSTVSALTAAHADVANSKAAIQAADQAVKEAQARAAEAKARRDLAESDLNRMKQLIAKEEISQQRYDTAVTAAAAAEAAYEAVQAAVLAAQQQAVQAHGALERSQAQLATAGTAPQQVAVTQARATGAEAAVAKARAALQQAELNLQYTTVRAPFAGVVSKRAVEPGQVVQAGQPLFAVVNLEDIWVTANFKETQLKNMRPGQPATVHVDAYGRDYAGHVDSIGGATGAKFSLLPPENATGNYVKVVQRIPVKIVFEKGQDPKHLLRPGMSVVPTVKVK